MARAKYKKRSDGRYLVQIQTGFDENGKQKFKNIYAKTIPELEKKINTFKYNLNRGIVVDDQNLTFKEWANNWLDTYKTNVTTRTRKRYKSIIDIQLKSLHNIKLSKLKTVNIQKTINELTTSVSLTIKILKQIIKQAMINELIFKDLMLGVSFSTQEPKKRRQLNEQEREAIEKADFSAKERTFVYLCLYAGLRRGDDDDKIRLNQRKPSKYKGLSRFGPEKNLQRINKFMKERPIFYKNLIQMKENFRFYLRCFYCITKVVILQFNSENRTELARNG